MRTSLFIFANQKPEQNPAGKGALKTSSRTSQTFQHIPQLSRTSPLNTFSSHPLNNLPSQ